jgi:hypothetical protein
MQSSHLAFTDSLSECNVLAVTIIAAPTRGEIRVVVDHSPEVTRTEDGESRTVTSRSFPRRVACPISAAQTLAAATRKLHPTAIVTLVNA